MAIALQQGNVGASFGSAACSYDQAAQLQRRTCGLLLAMLDGAGLQPGLTLDLGCGTGRSRGALQTRFPASRIVGLDLAEGMLQCARNAEPQADWVAADAAALPLADDSADLIYSNLCLQWCRELTTVLGECRRVLRPAGELCFSTLGPRTLQELRTAWAAVDDYRHVNEFLPERALRDALQQAGLDLVGFERHLLTESHPDVLSLCRGLKAIGAHNINAGRSAGLVGRGRFRDMSRAYECYRRADGSLPATWELLLVRARPR